MQTVSRTARAADETVAATGQEELISAWMDGQVLDKWPAALTAPAGRQAWETYHLIGDVLRNPQLAARPSDGFRARLSQALEAELPIVAPSRRRPLRLGLSGLAVAAAVASVVWVAQPYFVAPAQDGTAMADASFGPSDDPALRDYLEAHRQVAGPSAVRQVSFETGAGR